MSALRTFMVLYTEPGQIDWLFFRCEAEDGDHAEEQCTDAYPGCGIVGVYRATTAAGALHQMQAEMGWANP